MSYILRSTKFVRSYFFGLARSIVISNRREGNLLQKSYNLTSAFPNNFLCRHLTLQSNSALEQTIRQLDEDARRIGRISITEIEEALNNIKNSRKATTSQSLMVIRCCGNLIPEETPEQRTKLVEEIWKTFESLGVPLDISHHNALLKVYLENEHKFSPTDFLAKLEANGIEPNRVTYQRLIAGFCQQGDISGATKILEFMKEKQLPISEGVFNALVFGHSKAGDMESAEGILNVMRQANLEPSNETYATLVSGYAEKGDGAAVERLLTDCKVKDVLLSDRDYLEIVCAAATNGHDQLVDEILKNIRRSMGYNQDAANTIIRLVTAGKDEVAYKVFLTLNPMMRSDSTPNMSGHLFIKQLVKSNRSVEEISQWCERLAQDGHTTLGLWIAVDTSFYHDNVQLTLDLLREMKRRDEPVRLHYFWPSLVTAGKSQDYNYVMEILRMMKEEYDLAANSETIKDYILPYIPDSKSTNEVLMSLDSVGVKRGQAVVAYVTHLLTKKKTKEAAGLACDYSKLNYRNGVTPSLLVELLQQTGDVGSVVKLVQVLSQSGSPTARDDQDEEDVYVSSDDFIRRFFTYLINSGSSEKYLSDVFREMLVNGLPISTTCAMSIESQCKLTPDVSELLAKLSSGEIKAEPIRRAGTAPIIRTPESLANIKERMKANNEPEEKLIGINRSFYQAYCREGDVENALKIRQELKEEYKQETTPGMWASLLDAYCLKNDIDGAKSCLKYLEELDPEKILKLAKVCVENNRLDEATDLLKTVKARAKEEGSFGVRNNAWLLLQAATSFKDPEVVKNLLNLLVENKFVEVNNVMLGPVIKAYLLRDDLEGALKEFEEYVKVYRATPMKNELTIKFIEKEDAAKLQTVVDLSTEVHGEVNSLYDLVLAFIECGKIKQARKVLDTPGLTSRNNRLSFASERYKSEGKVEFLERLVDATKDASFIDRSQIYKNLLDTYCQANEVDKALGLWTKMQDEDVQVTDEFLTKLGNFLKNKGCNVPFKIPEVQTRDAISAKVGKGGVTTSPKRPERTIESNVSPLRLAIRKRDTDEALKIKDRLVSEGQQISRGEVNGLLELLVQENRLREATALVETLSSEQTPYVKTLNYLITTLANKGETELLQRVGQSITDDLKRLASFSNKLIQAAVVRGNVKEELDKIEKEIDAASSNDDIDACAAKFPRGGIMAVLEEPSYHEQVTRIVDKFFSKGSSSPANCLVMHFLTKGDLETTNELYQKYNLKNNSKLMFRPVLSKARVAKDPQPIENLLTLIKDSPAATPESLSIIYSNLINLYCNDNNFETALQRLEEALKTVSLDMIYNTTLVRLKAGLEASNKTFKYTIPPRKQRESSSSSSSSDSEPKKSVASN